MTTSNGLTGNLFEWSVLGRALAIPSVPAQSYLPYTRAMAVAREHPAWDPTDPDPRQANDLHAWVCEGLGVEDYSQVCFYSALGTPLDRFHGVDCWFEVGGRVVTIDLTTDPSKERYKADVVLHPEDLEDGGKAVAEHISALLGGRRGAH